MLRLFGFIVAASLLTGCRWNPSNQIEIQVRSPSEPARLSRGNPTDPLDLQCFFATVLGDDIKPTLPTTASTLTSSCLELGANSGLVDKDELMSNGIKMTVAAGAKRRVRLMGIQGINTSCGKEDLATLLEGTTTLQMFPLGETYTDLFKDTEVAIENGYKPATVTELISFCTPIVTVPTSGITGIGTLERIYVGSTSSTFTTSDINGILPTQNSAGQFGNMTSIPIDEDAVGATSKVWGFNPLPAGGMNGHIRMDFVFSATITPGNFFKVEVSGFAGTSFFDGASCGNAFDSSGILSMALWDQSILNWDSVESGSFISVQGPDTFRATESGDGLTGDFYHVSLRSDGLSDWNTLAGFGTCSALRLVSVHTSEYNPALMSSNNSYVR